MTQCLSGDNPLDILLFDPRREHSSAPTASLKAVERRGCQGWPRLRGNPKGLALTGPSTAARSMRRE